VAGRMDLRRKMIVLEGVDGAGKSTATRLLAQRLEADGLDVAVHDFPVYDEPRFGPLARAVLDGSIRVQGERAPYVIASLFAGNRAATAPMLRAEQAAGKTLLCDRYHLANAAYQGAQLADAAELDEFLDWILDVELNIFGALRPDVCVWLRVPLDLRPDSHGEDVYERDLDLQRRVHAVYARLAERGDVIAVDLAPAGELLTPDAVADAIYSAVCASRPT